ncbi:MAG: glycosyltransferase [Anaerolineae bacterium]|nr:glycosyltransferase [Anaerolineae bacterium]
MRIMMVHNHYKQPGGEDVVFAAERDMLRSQGNHVIEYRVHNDLTAREGKLQLAAETVWSPRSRRSIADLIDLTRPDVAHFHNTFMLISPSAYYACHARGIPVVQTLHNYRLICPAAILFRNGHICEDCVGKSLPYLAALRSCYHGSLSQSAAVAGMLAFHRALHTWTHAIDHYITLTEFSRQKFIQGGLPADKLSVKPNFTHSDLGVGDRDGGYVLYAGRLTPEKGVETLIEAWRSLPDIPLKIAGDGPLRSMLTQRIQQYGLRNVEMLGHVSRAVTSELMRRAYCLVFPSVWYEVFGMTIVEAYSCGLPVIAAELGSVAEVVEHNRTGLHFAAGDAQGLAARVREAFGRPGDMQAMARHARAEYEMKYTAQVNYNQLMAIYESLVKRARRAEAGEHFEPTPQTVGG